MAKHKIRKAAKAALKAARRDKKTRRAFECGYIAHDRADYFKALKGKGASQ